MARIRSTLITGSGSGSGSGNCAADKRIHARKITAGTTASGTEVTVSTNSRSLESLVESGSLRTVDVYDWRKGTVSTKPLDVLTNAQTNINRLKVPTVTSGRSERSKKGLSDSPRGPGWVPTVGGRS